MLLSSNNLVRAKPGRPKLLVSRLHLGVVALVALILQGRDARADDNSPIAFSQVVCRSASGQSAEEEQECLKSVKTALVEKYIASLGPERKPLVAARKDAILASSGRYLENLTVRSRQFDKAERVFTIAAQADVNVSEINALVDQKDAAGERLPIVFIFVARRQSEVESKGPKVVSGSQETKNEQVEATAVSKAGDVLVSSTEKMGKVNSTASSVTRSADRIVYVVENHAAASIDRTMSKVFIDRGFDVVPASEMLALSNGKFDPDQLKKDFEVSSEFTLEHQRMATKTCREAGAPLLAYGTLTIGVQSIDPANARHTVVNVTVDGVVLDCRKQFTLKVGSIGALQVNGVGADQTEAETAALDKAATKAAGVLADQLRSRNIR